MLELIPMEEHRATTLSPSALSAPVPLAIPTDDPAAALVFCRQLAGLLNGTGSVASASAALQAPAAPELSVIIPVFNEEENLPALYTRLTTVLSTAVQSHEIIFVDDGSRDTSLPLLRNLAASDARVCVVELARNFGHQVAISAGLDHARGTAVIVMDADLQDPP